MTIGEALSLLRDKYVEEVDGVFSGPRTDRYREACQKFPVAMAVAHQLFAQEQAKNH